jgi:hypothetical protein
VAYGEEFHIVAIDPRSGAPLANCPRCGTPRWTNHHEGCPVEECPFCQRMAMACRCLDEANGHGARTGGRATAA